MGDAQDRLARIEAKIYGPTRRTPEADAQERRAEIAALYMAWRMGGAEEPYLEDPEDLRMWEQMRSYEEVAVYVANRVESKGVADERYWEARG